MSKAKFEEIAQVEGNSDTPNQDFDISIGSIFQALASYITSIDDDDKESDELITLQEDSCAKHMDTLWNVQFTQRDPSIEDKVIQINMGTDENLKHIFISETLIPSEKENLVALIREYINIFAQSYEDMPGWTHKLLCIV